MQPTKSEIEQTQQLVLILEVLSLGVTGITGQLRHAYKQLNDETVTDQKELANGLIAPQIARLEELVILLQKAMERYHDALRDYTEDDTRH